MRRMGYGLLFTTLTACGAAGGGDANGGGRLGPQGLENSLRELGVDTTPPGPRIGPAGAELEPDDAPLASRATLDRVDELVIAGLGDGSATLELVELDAGGEVASLLQQADDALTWAGHDLRATGAADLDGDGRDELAVAYFEEGAVWVDVYEDAAGETLVSAERVAGVNATPDHLALAAGDFDGDGVEELALAYSLPGRVVISRLNTTAATLVDQIELDAADTRLRIEMEAGRLDVDAAEELVVLINHAGDVVSRWIALDDANTGWAELASGAVEARDASGRTESAVAAGLGVGDFDDDGLDEIGLGGVVEVRPSCGPFAVMVVALDDALGGFDVVAEHREERRYHPCSAVSPWRMEAMFVDALDVDGDGVMELHVNDGVYDDLRDGEWVEAWTVDKNHIFPLGDTHGGRLNPERTSMAAGDFDADGFAEIAIYSENSGITRTDVLVYGLRGPDGVEGFGLKATIPVGRVRSRPELLAVNVDEDSTTVAYDEGSYDFVFTEPVVIAVLAAPPCDATTNQAAGGCQTSFGQSEIIGNARERQVQTRATAHVGLEAGASFFGLFEVKAKETISKIRNRTRSWQRSYTLEKTITYTSGHLEDAVVFTTIPYDRYTYTVLTHPDADLVGTRIVVSLPREPITLIAERTYYNDHLVEGAPRIDATVLPHTPGDPSTYASRSEISRLAPAGWLASDEVTVGQGGGATEVQLRVSEAISRGGSLETGYQVDAEVTGGNVIAGWSVGQSETDSLIVTSGEATTYTGSVPSLDAEGFEDRLYDFGLFTYVKEQQGRRFQVLNYWVD